jgi:uncharacterized membrane protein
MWQQLWRNLFSAWFKLPQWFPESRMRALRDGIAIGERSHAGELCFAVEARYSPMAVLTGITARRRAEQVFSALRIWDTQDNSGVLVYLQLAERRIEIVADRGIAARVPLAQWDALCRHFAKAAGEQTPDVAIEACLAEINALLAMHFPAQTDNPKELPDEPVIL